MWGHREVVGDLRPPFSWGRGGGKGRQRTPTPGSRVNPRLHPDNCSSSLLWVAKRRLLPNIGCKHTHDTESARGAPCSNTDKTYSRHNTFKGDAISRWCDSHEAQVSILIERTAFAPRYLFVMWTIGRIIILKTANRRTSQRAKWISSAWIAINAL